MINGYVYDYVHRNIIGDLLLPSSYTTNWKKYTYTNWVWEQCSSMDY